MSWAKEFIELDKAVHDRASFDCGEVELNEFIWTKAARHMTAGISRTMLLPASVPLPDGKYPICTFYTITPSSISRETLPEKLMKKLPRYPVPVFLLAQLAVHSEYHSQGLGKITLIKALEYLWEINFHMRAYAIIVDCLNETAENFYSKYGFEVLCCHNSRVRMFMPMKIAGQLF
ncbi:MAG: GNAT family N-acetyltransferase [Thermodesulfobacteriota bacterium]|nr:GNAT family N-acetyltransferase [Thermodesulfobacteriota bacterium]